VFGDFGKKVASSSHSSAIDNACSISETSFAPTGEEPCAVVNFFAVSLTMFLGSGSDDPVNPGPFIQSFENCS
jgi:hypothetical protein